MFVRILKNGVKNIINEGNSSRVRHLTNTKTQCSGGGDLSVHRDTEDNNANIPFRFTAENITRIVALVKNYPEGAQASAVCSLLDLVQRQNGWIPISAMHEVATALQMPRMRVYEVSTFYTMLKKRDRGKYHIKVCTTTPCWLRGSDAILRAAEEAACCRPGSVSPNGIFGVDEVECQGACINAPVMAIDDDYYEDLTVNDVYKIIETIKCGGVPPAGPQSGRMSCEPITGETTLSTAPPGPGFMIQPDLQPPVDCRRK